VKLIGPLMLIFIALMLVLMGPFAINIMNSGFM
jgi:hypothetical protein